MRVETVQLRAPEDWVFRWARWGGLALLFYAGVLALDNLPSARDGHPLWTLLVLMLPYVAPAYVLLFSSERLAGHDSAAPRWFGLAVVTASLALAIRVVASDDRLMGPVYAEGA